MFYIIISYIIITIKHHMFYGNDKKVIENNEEDHKSNHNVNIEFENWWGQFEDIEKPF